jgi:hypothetical protein
VDLSSADQGSVLPHVAMDRAGDAVVVWSSFNGADRIVQAAARPAGGSFTAPVNLSAPGQDAREPHVALDAAGDAVVVWERFVGTLSITPVPTRSIVQAAVRVAGGGFSTAVDVSDEPGTFPSPTASPQVAMDAVGGAVVAWQGFNGRESIVEASVRPVGGSFSPRIKLSAAGQGGIQPKLAMDQAGDAVAVWLRAANPNPVPQAAVRLRGGRFSAPVDLADDGLSQPQVAMGGAGDAVAVWLRSDGGTQVQASATVALPAIRRLRVSPTVFAAAERGGAIARRRGTSTTISYTHAQPWTTAFTVFRPAPGVKRRGRCVAPPRRGRPNRGTRCTRYLVVGRFSHTDRAGRSRFRFTGRVRSRKLAPGRYRLQATPLLRGPAEPVATAGFRVIP